MKIVFIISFLIGYLIYGNGFNLFLSGLLGGGLVWLLHSYRLHTNTEGVLTEKMVQIIGLSESLHLIIVAGLIGGVCAAFGAVTGNSFRKIFVKKKQTSLYS